MKRMSTILLALVMIITLSAPVAAKPGNAQGKSDKEQGNGVKTAAHRLPIIDNLRLNRITKNVDSVEEELGGIIMAIDEYCGTTAGEEAEDEETDASADENTGENPQTTEDNTVNDAEEEQPATVEATSTSESTSQLTAETDEDAGVQEAAEEENAGAQEAAEAEDDTNAGTEADEEEDVPAGTVEIEEEDDSPEDNEASLQGFANGNSGKLNALKNRLDAQLKQLGTIRNRIGEAAVEKYQALITRIEALKVKIDGQIERLSLLVAEDESTDPAEPTDEAEGDAAAVEENVDDAAVVEENADETAVQQAVEEEQSDVHSEPVKRGKKK